MSIFDPTPPEEAFKFISWFCTTISPLNLFYHLYFSLYYLCFPIHILPSFIICFALQVSSLFSSLFFKHPVAFSYSIKLLGNYISFLFLNILKQLFTFLMPIHINSSNPESFIYGLKYRKNAKFTLLDVSGYFHYLGNRNQFLFLFYLIYLRLSTTMIVPRL